MEAIEFTLCSKTLKLTKPPKPKIENLTDVLIKVAYAGICGTDLHIIHGHYKCNPSEPVILGHEISGTIVEIGLQVDHLAPGDKVVIDPNIGCHRCTNCRNGKPHLCEDKFEKIIGIYKNGGWAEYVISPQEQVHKLPESIGLEHAVLCEPLSCISHGFDLIGNIKIGSNILVMGAGIIGRLFSCILHLKGHRSVIITELNETRSKNFEKLELDFEVIKPNQLKCRVGKDPTYLFDYVIDCTGDVTTLALGLETLDKSGTFVIFGVTPREAKLAICPRDIHLNELRIKGVALNPFSIPNAIDLLEAMGARYLDYEKLGIGKFALKDYEKALQSLGEKVITKAVFDNSTRKGRKCSCD